MNKKEPHALKGKHRESGKIKCRFNANIPSTLVQKKPKGMIVMEMER